MEVLSSEEQKDLWMLSSEQRKAALLGEFSYQADAPADDDQIIAAYCRASAREIEAGPLNEVINEALYYRHKADRPPLSARDLVNQLLRAFQKQLLRNDLNYPSKEYETDEKWLEVINEILNDPEDREELDFDLTYRVVQTNIADRYKAHRIIMQSESERLGPNPTFLDIGTGDLHGPKKLRLDGEFGPVVSLIPASNRYGLSEKFLNDILKQPFRTGESIGIDESNPRDQRNSAWVFACSFRPNELYDIKRREEHRRLHDKKVSRLHFYEGDILVDGVKQIREQSPVKKFDVITYTTMLYMIKSNRQRQAMREVARTLLKPGGLIIYQDFAQPNPKKPDQLQFFRNWPDYTYRTMIEDPADKSERLHEVFQWRTGRCNELKLGRSIGRLSIARQFS